MSTQRSRFLPIANRHWVQRRAGSLLLEVLLAVGIFSVGIVSLAVCLDRTIDTVNMIRRDTRLRQELQTRLDDLRQNRLQVETKDEDPDNYGIQYTHDISLLQIQSDRKTLLNNLYDVKVTAKWREAGVDQQRVSEIYVYQP